MFEVGRLIEDCRQALTESVPQSAIKEIVERAASQPREIEKALGTPKSGGLNTLYRSPELTILNIVWSPCMTLYPHDHRMWAVIGLYGGREDNVFYRRTREGIEAAGGRQLEAGDTVTLGKAAIHSVTNPWRQFTGAIHVYGGDFFGVPRSEWDPKTLTERPYDVERAKRLFADASDRFLAEEAAGSTTRDCEANGKSAR
jgi:predicted metal-dependent enzyme (double-stranded beta helix superfamily)